MSTAPVYLDYAATTPVDPRVAAAMAECLTQQGCFGNAASTHAAGRAARARIEKARQQVAMLLGAAAPELIWTSGATESNNLALLGAARAARGEKHVITARTEHKAVLDPCKQLEREGVRVTYLDTDAQGLIDPQQVAAALRPQTVLVSIMHANNEIGVLQDIAAIGAQCRAHGVLLHVDASQSVGRVPVDVQALHIDLLSCTAHKLYGPKGVGILYVRDACRARLQPLLFGGGHERGLRSGTLATHQIVGFGLACEIARNEGAADAERVGALRARLWQGLEQLPQVLLNGHPERCVAGILNVTFAGVEGESLLFGLPELCVSTGSACNSDRDEPSYVLRALGRDTQQAQSSLRLSLGRFSTAADVDAAVAAISREVRRLRAIAP
ncbi:MAG: aminotransferase class V-fold PLP-dependent enzyme [Steroidobacteraceae bacterium]